MMFTRQVLLAAISCYGAARIAVVSSFVFVPSTRPSVGQSRPTFPTLFATGEAQQEKNTFFASEKKEDDAVKLVDGLNLEKFNVDLGEFWTDKEMMRKNVDDDISRLPKPESLVIPWKFQDKYDIRVEVTYPKLDWKKCDGFSSQKVPQNLPVVLLVHGFGCSIVYWRQTVRALAKQGYVVYAMDLLGHGKSAKASEDVTYSTALWAEQLDDFCEQILTEDEDIVLIGNKVGSLVSLLAASGSEDACIRKRIRGIEMFNCGIGLNIHGIARDPKWGFVERFFLNKIFAAMELLESGTSTCARAREREYEQYLRRNSDKFLSKSVDNRRWNESSNNLSYGLDSYYSPP